MAFCFTFGFRFIVRLFLVLCSLLVVSSNATAGLPGGRREATFTVNGEWIGNGVCFGPYRDGQSPAGRVRPSVEEICEDLKIVARYWKLIRTYDSTSVSADTLTLIRREHLPIKVMLGVWINPDQTAEQREGNRVEVANAIRLANAYPDIVLAVSVGNEACVWWSGYRTEPAALIAHIRTVRAAIKQPVTTADDSDFWRTEESKPVAAAVDFITYHAYALWRGQPVDQSIQWLEQGYEDVVRLHAGTPVVIGETGWASRHDPRRNGADQEGMLMKGEVSEAAQLSYLRLHYRWVQRRRVPTFLFEAFDENWKGGGEKVSADVAEKHWGVFDARRRPKSSFQVIITEFYSVPR